MFEARPPRFEALPDGGPLVAWAAENSEVLQVVVSSHGFGFDVIDF